MKKFSLFALVIMIGLVSFLGGCRKDVVEDLTYYEDAFFDKYYTYVLLNKQQKLQKRSNDNQTKIDSVIKKVFDYIENNNLHNTKDLLESRFGYPLWPHSQIIRVNSNKFMSITPVYNPDHKLITNFIFFNSENETVKMMSLKNSLKLEFLALQEYFSNIIFENHNPTQLRATGNDTGSPSGGGGPSTVLDCVTIIDIETDGQWTEDFEGGYEGTDSGWDVNGGTLIFNNYTSTISLTTSWFNVSSYQECEGHITGENSNNYSNESNGGSSGGSGVWKNITNWKDCKNYFHSGTRPIKDFGETEVIREKMMKYCGCEKIYKMSDNLINYLETNLVQNNNSKVACYLCFGQSDIIQQLDKFTFPCDDVDKNAIYEELIDDCTKLVPTHTLYDKLKGKTYFHPQQYGGYKFSPEIVKMGLHFNISNYQLSQLSNEDLCDKIKLSSCLSSFYNNNGLQSNEQSTQEVENQKLLYFYLNTNLINPCTGDEIDKDDILLNLCESGNVNMEGLNDALARVDYITNALGECPNADCMLKKLINVVGTNICDVAKIFDSSPDSNFGLRISVASLAPINGITPYGIATYSNGETKITLDINRICNEPNPLIVAETILHEMMHAFFFESMEKIGWNGNDNTKQQYFDQLIDNWMSESPGKTHHEIMTLYYLEPMANTLWNLNNHLGQPSDYYGLILYGLNSTHEGMNNVIINEFNLNDQDILSAYATSLNTVVNSSTLTYSNCD